MMGIGIITSVHADGVSVAGIKLNHFEEAGSFFGLHSRLTE